MAPVDPHYLWALGHAVVLFSSAYILLQTVLFRGTPFKTYRLAYSGALLSYSIVVYKSLGRPQLNQAWLRRAMVDENVQYAILAVFWWFARPINLSILPFATFSLFHCLTFLRTNIIPKLVPRSAPTAAGAQGQAAQRPPAALDNISRQIQIWVKTNYDSAMRFVAYAELLILARLVLGVVTFRTPFVIPLFLVHFIRLRYHASPFTRTAVNTVTARIDTFAANQGGPVQNAWGTIKRVIGAWGGVPILGPSAPGTAAGAGAGGAGPGAQAQAAQGAARR